MARYAARIRDNTVVEVLVIADGDAGDDTIAALDLVEQPDVHPGIGWSWNGSAFSPSDEAPASWQEVRAQRDGLLTASDWTMLTDAPITTTAKTSWKAYRQALRDIPQTYDTPADVIWPDAP